MIIIISGICLLLFDIYIFFPKPHPIHKQHYDAILILGYPAKEDGTISIRMKSRCDFALQLMQQNMADMIIVSGGAVKNEYVEADVMEAYLHKQSKSLKVEKERCARNTFQNLKFTKETFPVEHILIITSPAHIRRAFFFSRKFYLEADVVKCENSDSISAYLFEYTRLWICLYYEWKLKK